jgi:hypothetical protein
LEWKARRLLRAQLEATEKVVIFEKCCFLGGQKCLLTSLSWLRSESGASFFKHHFLFLKSWTFSVVSAAGQVRPRKSEAMRRLSASPAESEAPGTEINGQF